MQGASWTVDGMVWVANAKNQSETGEYALKPVRPRTGVGQIEGFAAAGGRAQGRQGSRPQGRQPVRAVESPGEVRLAQAAMAHHDSSVCQLCRELGIKPVTLYRYVGPQGQLRQQGEKVLA